MLARRVRDKRRAYARPNRPRTDNRASGRLRPASRAPAASLRDGLWPPLTRTSADLLCSAIGTAPPSVPDGVGTQERPYWPCGYDADTHAS